MIMSSIKTSVLISAPRGLSNEDYYVIKNLKSNIKHETQMPIRRL